MELWNQGSYVVSFLETQHKDPGQGVSVLEPRVLMTIPPFHLQLKGILVLKKRGKNYTFKMYSKGEEFMMIFL